MLLLNIGFWHHSSIRHIEGLLAVSQTWGQLSVWIPITGVLALAPSPWSSGPLAGVVDQGGGAPLSFAVSVLRALRGCF